MKKNLEETAGSITFLLMLAALVWLMLAM